MCTCGITAPSISRRPQRTPRRPSARASAARGGRRWKWRGATAGFRYSRVGGGDRLSSLEPSGAGNGRISDGFNKYWDLGGGLAANRTVLPANSGLWPNAIRIARTTSGSIPAGSPFALNLAHQSGTSAAGSSGVRIFLDDDTNPYNGNETVIDERLLPNTGPSAVQISTLTATTNPAIVPPGNYAIGARIMDGVRTRYLYVFDPRRDRTEPAGACHRCGDTVARR
jgi:hypothetical protein